MGRSLRPDRVQHGRQAARLDAIGARPGRQQFFRDGEYFYRAPRQHRHGALVGTVVVAVGLAGLVSSLALSGPYRTTAHDSSHRGYNRAVTSVPASTSGPIARDRQSTIRASTTPRATHSIGKVPFLKSSTKAPLEGQSFPGIGIKHSPSVPSGASKAAAHDSSHQHQKATAADPAFRGDRTTPTAPATTTTATAGVTTTTTAAPVTTTTPTAPASTTTTAAGVTTTTTAAAASTTTTAAPETTTTTTTTPATTTTTTTTAPTTPSSPQPVDNVAFVKSSGTILTLNERPYTFTGVNIYMAASGGTPSSCGGELYPDVSVPLSDMPSGIVFRFWAFQDFFVSNGAINWTNFDQVLAVAAAHDDKVIPVLANGWNYCDGPAKELTWFQSGYKATIEPGDLATYRQYVAQVVSRYASNPVIAMWQLINEGQALNDDGTCDESAALSALLGFSNDIGGLVHSVDPNHLVSLGVIPGYGGGSLQFCGAANGDYQTLMASPGNDVCDYHDYGYPTDTMGIPTVPDLATAIAACHADDRPIMVAETGIYATSAAQLPTRAVEFRAKFSAQFQAGVVGELMWCWAAKPAYVVPMSDPDYGISPGDPSLAVLWTS